MGSILLAILLLAILIVVHELGHFWAARLMKIEVVEFGVGFGPKLFGWKSRKHGTRFVIRAIPLGGYNAFVGDEVPGGGGEKEPEPAEETAEAAGRGMQVKEKKIDSSDPRLFANQNVWKRMFVVVMGPVMNFLLAFVLATGFYWANGIPTAMGVDPYISGVNAAGPAYDAGLMAGDVITEINGVPMLDGTMDTLLSAISSYKQGDAPLEATVLRGDETLHLTLQPLWNEEEQRMMVGITVGGKYRIVNDPATLIQAAGASGEMCWRAAGLILNALKNLVTTGEGFEDTSGPIGIISIVSTEVRSGGFQAFLELLITISINLGLMNLLPIPGLDGSKLVLGIVEAIRRRPIPKKMEAVIDTAGVVLLLGLMLVMTFKDVLKLIH